MRLRGNIVASVVLLAGSFYGCSSGGDPVDSKEPPAKRYFFPATNGAVYSYVRTVSKDGHISTDTLRCQLDVAQNLATKNDLRDIKTGNILYFFDLINGNRTARLSSGNITLYALDGGLQDSSTWVADPSNHIRATVIEHLDDYYPPRPESGDTHFSDVVSVLYRDDSIKGGSYTLRFFAAGHGLIREAEVAPGGAEISSLQVLKIE